MYECSQIIVECGYKLGSAARRFVSTHLWGSLLEGLLKTKDRKLAQILNSSFHYIDGVLSLNNYRFSDYLHIFYPNKLEVKDTTDTQNSASYIED
jgi:hypothetical protein